MKIVTVGEVASAAGSAYGSYEGGLGDSSNQALFAAAVAGGASALAIAQNGQPFLNGLGMGVAPAASTTQLAINIANLMNAQTPSEALSASLGKR